MNNKLIINPGELREKIQVINVLEPKRNSRGFVESTRINKFSTRAKLTKMKISNDTEIEVSGVKHIVSITLRYNSKILPSSYIEFRGNIYKIDDYDNVDYLNRVLRLELSRYDGKEVAKWLEE